MARAMKDSGIPWIGEIPVSWNVIKNKYLLEEMYSGGTPTASNEGFYAEEGIPFVSIGDMSTTEYVNDTKKKLTEEGIKDKNLAILPAGTILYSIYATIGAVSELQIPATISQAMLALRLKPSFNKRFYKYNLYAMRDYIFYNANGNTQFNLNAEKVWNFSFVQSSIDEQERIAQFLDVECARIDAVMEQTRASIEEYKKLKQSIITEAVTKGIRPNRSMKDSGIDWVKEIPVEWLVIPAKHLFRDSDVRKQEGDEQMTASQQYGIITQKLYMELTGAKVVFANKGIEDWKHIEPYDFVISLRSFQGGLEMSETTGCITWHYIVLRPCKVIHSYFYKWLFKSEIYINALQRTCNFIRDGQDLRYSNFIQVPLFEPSIGEQREISDYLNSKCAEIEAMITKKRKLLSEMEFYKKSLIFEYVTGKKEVI